MTDDELEELWNERAAVREYDGGLSRQHAEIAAGIDIRRSYGRVPAAVLLRILPVGPVRSMIERDFLGDE